ncbi:DUF4391 domain-containing protein [Lutibacter sp.]
MNVFNLPQQTIKNKSIPKNAFYGYTNTKQKQLFVDVVEKIKWAYNLSTATINLEGNEVQEIQIFEVNLKQKHKIETVLNVIEKAIPYHIIFIVSFEDEMMLYTSQKHNNPTNENNAIVDWVFKTDWFLKVENRFRLNLKESLDAVYKDFCFQISNRLSESTTDLKSLIEKEQKLKELNTKIAKLESQIKSCKQFNNKVELNIELQKLKIERELNN